MVEEKDDSIGKALAEVLEQAVPTKPYKKFERKTKKRGAGYTKRRICKRTGKSSSR